MSASPPPATLGVWSGDRVTLTLTATSGSFVEDCADATMGAPVWSKGGKRFTAEGSRSAYRLGPQLADVPADPPLAVHYSGTLRDGALLLSVRSGEAPAAAYRARRGVNIKRVRCL